jgi:glycosyltransferase involved in cell wall biosynthesis
VRQLSETAPRVSVVTIFFNAEAFIEEAIASVMAQTDGDFELLLCDDGSNDSSSAIAQSWERRLPSKVRYLEHKGHANQGMSATRNLGLRAARGEFVAFLDADDVWRPDKLGEQIAIMQAHPELGMVCGAVNYWRSWAGGEDSVVRTGHVQNRVVPPPESAMALYPLGSAPAPCPSDMLLRREAVEAVGRFEEHFSGSRQIYEDQGFLAKLYLAWPVYFSDAVWLDYRQHPHSIVATVTREGLYDDARYYFLTWLEGYLNRLADEPPEDVKACLTRALRPYRRPVIHMLATLPGRLIGKGHKSLGRLGAAIRGKAA